MSHERGTDSPSLAGESKDGPFFAVFAALLAGFGLTLLIARRVAAVLILGAILAVFGAIAAVVDLLDVADPDGVPAALQPSVGVGLPVVVGGFVLAFAGVDRRPPGGTSRRRARSVTSSHDWYISPISCRKQG